MPYFSRLSDIVTCNLTAMLQQADDPSVVLADIIREMEEGVAGAERSTHTAVRNVRRIAAEIDDQRRQVVEWVDEAKSRLQAGDEQAARQALLRKREVEDLVAALEDQLRAAESTRDHLQKTLHALQARLADARRRLAQLEAEHPEITAADAAGVPAASGPADTDRMQEIESELDALRRQLAQPE